MQHIYRLKAQTSRHEAQQLNIQARVGEGCTYICKLWIGGPWDCKNMDQGYPSLVLMHFSKNFIMGSSFIPLGSVGAHLSLPQPVCIYLCICLFSFFSRLWLWLPKDLKLRLVIHNEVVQYKNSRQVAVV